MNTPRLWTLVAACVAVAVPVCSFGPPTASAAPSPESDWTATVDLSQSWGQYQNCLVTAQKSVECFTSGSAFSARTDQLAATSSCPVRLYRGSGYTGQELALYPEGVWVNLSDFGFDNATVSFIGSGCGFHLAENQWGGGWWYPGYTGAWAATPNMGASWNYRVSSVYIN